MRINARDVAQLADIDASNLSRIEKGKYSAGLDILCRIAAAMDCHLDIVPNSNRVNMAGHIIPENHKKWLITAKRSTFRLAECLEKYGEYHWQQSRYNVSLGDTIYIYVSEDREIKYRMTVEAINVRYDQWMVKEEEFWVDKERINQDESEVKYALLRLEATSKSGKLTEENLTKDWFLWCSSGHQRTGWRTPDIYRGDFNYGGAFLTFALDEGEALVHVDDVAKGMKCVLSLPPLQCSSIC